MAPNPPPPKSTRVPPSPCVAPLAPAALAVIAGVILDRSTSAAESATWAVIGGVLGTLAGGLGRRPRLATPLVLLALAAVGAGWHHRRWSDLPGDDLARSLNAVPRPAWARGVLRDVSGHRPGLLPGQEGITRAVLELSEIHDAGTWRRASGRALLLASGDRSDLRAGSAVEVAGELGLVPPPLNPGEFDEREYLRAQGIRLRFSVYSAQGVWPSGRPEPTGVYWRTLRVVGALRAWSQDALMRGLKAEPETAALASALLLGRREGVEPEVNDAFARTGTTHLLAISGLHLQVLALALGTALRLAGLSRRGAFAAVAAATLAYALLVGLMPSVVRSAAMTVTYCLAGWLDRRARPANTLALAALATLALNPSHLFDVGCQLSFLAVGAIVWGVEPVMARLFPEPDALTKVERHFESRGKRLTRRAWRRLVAGVVVSLTVWFAAWPLAALRFHLVSPVGILLNIPLIPITSLALLAAGVSLALTAAGLPAGPAAWCCARLLGWTEAVVRWGVDQRWGYAFVPGPPWWYVLMFYAVTVLAVASIAYRRPSRRALAWLMVGLVPPGAALTMGLRPWRGEPGADVLAVGHGLAVVLDRGDGRAWLYDCGRMRDPSVGRRVVAPALWSRGVRRLDALILSHADADHYNGVPDILDRFSVGMILVPPGFGEGPVPDPGVRELLALATARGVPVRPVSAGERLGAGPFALTVLHPPGDWNSRPEGRLATDNARSLVVDVASGGRHLLLTGDLDGPGLARLADEAGGARPDVMLSPHHGGRTANPVWFHEAVGPGLLVASQRPPAPGTRDPLGELEARGLRVVRTWDAGALRLTWGRHGLHPRGFLHDLSPATAALHPPGTARRDAPDRLR